jgi:hypothetical protein
VLHPAGRHVLIKAWRGKRLIAQRYPKVKQGVARLRVKARRRGLYRVTAGDSGPPLRTARAQRRIR